MLQFQNQTPFAGCAALLSDPDGIDTLYTAVKGTFSLVGKMIPTDEQLPLVLADEFRGEPAETGLKAGSDVSLLKPGTDVLLDGHAYAPGGKAVEQVDVSLSIGPVRKTVRVLGDRAWQSGVFGARLPPPQPFELMPLVWERAFGGSDAEPGKAGRIEVEPCNPVGAGFRLPNGSKEVDGLQLPNLEDPRQLISSWKDRPAPAGFGPLCRHWEPRRSYAGTYDAAWQKGRAPYLPRDFDPRFFQLAPADQVVAGYLRGDEEVEATGVTPAGRLAFRLPAMEIEVSCRLANRWHTAPAKLDTVVIQPDEARLVLVWRSGFACDKKALQVSEYPRFSFVERPEDLNMAEDEVQVVGAGMMTPVGLSAGETAASVRAGIARFTPTAWRDQQFEPFTLAIVPDDGLPELVGPVASQARLTAREARLLRLAALPLLECKEKLPAGSLPCGLELALPDNDTLLPLDGRRFLERLSEQTAGAFDIKRSDAGHRGRAAGLRAVGRAAERVRGGEPFVLAGGVDTWCDSYLLGRLDRQQRVQSEVNLDGFIPGEGAGFVLVASAKAARAAGLSPLGCLRAVCEGFEEGHLQSEQPYRGEGLANTISKLLDAAALESPIGEVYSSMNGENHWGKEWGVSYLRNKDAFAPQHGFHHPADCYGDTGAGCGALLLGLAALGMRGGYRGSPALVCASSDSGARAAAVLTALNN